MNTEKPKKRTKKHAREHQILLGLVELYLESGKPIGSNTLKDSGFQNLSSATIRNYFAELEKQGLLRQPHFSGGRVPTNEAFRLYAEENTQGSLKPEDEEALQDLSSIESKNLVSFLQLAANRLSQVTGMAIFLSSVRFDHDLILDIKLVSIDHERVLCVLITDFGQVLTEIFPLKNKLSSFALKRIESYLQWRIKGGTKPDNLEKQEQESASELYNEIMIRYLVHYSNFSNEDIYRTGFSNLLGYPEFNDPVAIATALSLFENTSELRSLLKDASQDNDLCFWIGEELNPYIRDAKGCSVVTCPYYIGQTKAGIVGILGPCRMPYKTLFGALRFFTEALSKSLTKSLVKFKLSFRQPASGSLYIQLEERKFVDQKLLEIKEE